MDRKYLHNINTFTAYGILKYCIKNRMQYLDLSYVNCTICWFLHQGNSYKQNVGVYVLFCPLCNMPSFLFLCLTLLRYSKYYTFRNNFYNLFSAGFLFRLLPTEFKRIRTYFTKYFLKHNFFHLKCRWFSITIKYVLLLNLRKVCLNIRNNINISRV